MMMLFFAPYSRDGGSGIGISGADFQELLPQMSEYHTLYRHGSGCNGSNTHQTCKTSEHVAPETAQPIAAAPGQSSAPQLSGKNGSMPLFVGFELNQFGQQETCSQPCHSDLSSVDIYRTMFTRMVHLDDPPGVDG
jgi:hypothetical protein